MNHSNEPSQFKLHSEYQPTGDQPQAIAELVEGFRQGNQFETLLGVTGSGKTFTMANVIQALNKPTLIIAHNKTLAGQLYGEMKEFFPENAVEYFVSYYDYYQPEAYVPSSDTYIAKDSSINELKKFCKDNFDKDKIFSTAEELKYSSQIKNILTKQFESPTEDFVRFILADIYDGQKNQRIIEKFTPVVKRAFSSFVNEIVNSKISSALADDYDKDEESEPEIKEPASKIVTTEDEIESFYIIRGLLAGIVPVEDIVHRDTESYFGILYKDNNRKPICRLNLDARNKQLLIPDANKKFERIYIDSLNDLYKYKNRLIEVVKRYM